MSDPEQSGQDNSNPSEWSKPSEGQLRDALSEITKNLQWDKMMSDGDTSREVLSFTLSPEDRYEFLGAWKAVARDFALETGVMLPSVSFPEGTSGEIAWGEDRLGYVTKDNGAELLTLLKRNAWRFLTVRQVEARLKKLWTDRPELHRTYEEVNLGLGRTVRALRRLLREVYSLKSFASVMESLILAKSQYSAQAELVDAVILDLDQTRGKEARSRTPHRPSTGKELYEESRSSEIMVQLGRGLLCMVDPREGATLLERVTSLRVAFARRTGFVLPGVAFTDKLDLDPLIFRILVRDEVCFQGEIHPNLWLAIGPDHVKRSIRGIHTRDPIYGMPAVWVESSLREQCETAGCMIFTPESVVTMAFTETLLIHAAKLFTYGYLVEGILKSLKSDEGPLVDFYSASPRATKLAKQVFVRLMEEKVSIRDHLTILETVLEFEEGKGAEQLTEIVRKRLAGKLCEPYLQGGKSLHFALLTPELEELCLACLNEEQYTLEPDLEQDRKLRESFYRAVEALRDDGLPEVLLTSPRLRRPIRDFLCEAMPNLAVLSRDEVPAQTELVCLGGIPARVTAPPALRRPFPRGRRGGTRFSKDRS